ncbi:MAG: ABC transporter ATP-binding protein [Phycisphaerae bacterium]|nr:ABC transporter ATP-binding protein [Phycisphaerae bacterium]
MNASPPTNTPPVSSREACGSPTRADSADAIALRELTVHVGRRTLLHIADLTLGRGEFLGILGPNGAGKSTLLRACLGMQRHAQGHITMLGHPVRRDGGGRLTALRRQIGYIPQLLPERSEMPLTVREVVAIGRTGIAGLLRPLRTPDWDIIDAWIERMGLTPLAGRGFGDISGGEQRKTLIARAMVQRPKLLLLDEPSANLDLGWRERIVEIIHTLYEEERLTVVLVCHELEVLPACCRRVVVLDQGRIVADGPPEGVLTDERIAGLYGAGLTVLHQAGRHAVVPVGLTHA